MGDFIRSKKFVGVSYKVLKNEDRSYYIDYKLEKKFSRVHIGKKSEGINEAYCHQRRNEAINRHKFGDDAPIVKGKKRDFLTLDNLADMYFTDKQYENRENVRQKAKYKLHIQPVFGVEDVAEIEQDDIRQFREMLRSKNITPKSETPTYYASATVNGIVKLLSRIINYSIKNKQLKLVNPCIGISKLKVDNARERFLSLEEVAQLKERIESDPIVYMFVLLSLITGGRESTIMTIKKKDINFEQNIITLFDHKNNETYTGFLDQESMVYIQESCISISKNDYIIGGTSSVYPVRTIQNRLRKVFEELFNTGLEKKDAKNRVVIHTIRHTFASQLAIQGTPIFTIQKLMNHADIEQTMRYAKLAPDSGKEHVMSLYKCC